ncbi:F-box/kelch-repeat protein At3g06240-like [Rosa rugosa]|uniref:F-box/kelch-repeat protein At3g06240-like n=1 Tax=Rosa rugosa TaxID=74645 RepID=UPI002B40B140|nr:F-box/kelch-repeat protein At3g06240-like [Rosa rugosa]
MKWKPYRPRQRKLESREQVDRGRKKRQMGKLCKLSEEMVGQFLSRLPPKALMRFKCIHKSWYNLITSPSFIAKNLSNSKNNKFASTTRILFKRTVLKDIKDKNEIFYVLRDNNNDRRDIFLSLLDLCNDNDGDDQNLHSVVDDLIVPLPFSICPFSLQIAGHCDGLICLVNIVNEEVALCNPAIKEFKFLPRSSLLLPRRHPEDDDGIESDVNAVGFGYDSKTQDYKIVRVITYITGIAYTLPSKAEVYTLSSHSWREIKIDKECHVFWTPSFEIHFRGIYYWSALTYPTPGADKEAIFAFDMSEETFEEIPIPDGICARDGIIKFLAVWKESVALISCKGDGPKSFDIWVMDDSSGIKGSWTKHLVIGPIECEIPLVFWKSDELLLVISDGRVVSYHLGNKTIKYLPIHGVEDPQYIQAVVCVNSMISVKKTKG